MQLDLADRTVDLDRGVVRAEGADQRLTTKEVQLLAYLATRPGEVVPRERLLAEVWGYRPSALTRAVDNMMRKLRSKVEADPAQPVHLITVFGEGYRFDPTPVPTVPSDGVAPPLIREVGREGLVAQLRGWLVAGRRGLVLVGPAGIGKSTVARRVAVEEGATRAGGAWWCSVDGCSLPADLRRRVAATLGVAEPRLDHATTAIGAALVVLDGCDDLDPAAEALVEGWLARAPGLDLVATSRRRCLDRFATAVEVPALDRDASGALLAAQVDRVRPGRPLDPDQAALLVDRLQGWPLAIELAAARLRFLSPAEVVERLDAPGSPLDRALQASVDALDPAARQVLADCAVFEGGFAAVDAEAVSGDPDLVGVLHRLVDHGLVQASASGRLVLLDAIRSVAGRGVEQAPVRARHLARFATIAAEARVPPVQRHRVRVRAEWDNLRAAHRYAVAHAPERVAALALAMQRELGRAGDHRGRVELLEATLAAGPPPLDQLAVRQVLLNARAQLGDDLGDAHAALLAEAEALGEPEILAGSLVSMAQIHRRHGRPVEAEALCARGLELAAPPLVRCWLWLALAGILMDQSRYEAALGAYAEAEASAVTADDRELEGQVHWGRGLMEIVRGRPAAARAPLERALERCPDEPRIGLDAELVLAQVAMGLGDRAGAERWVEALRPRVARHGDAEREGVLLSILADLAVAVGDWVGAEAALATWSGSCRPHQAVYVAVNVGMVARLAGRTAEAVDQLVRARDEALGAGAVDVGVRATVELAAALADLGEVAAAEAELDGSRADPDDPFAAVARAHVAAAKGRAGSAEDAARARSALAALAVGERSVALEASLRRLAEVVGGGSP